MVFVVNPKAAAIVLTFCECCASKYRGPCFESAGPGIILKIPPPELFTTIIFKFLGKGRIHKALLS